MYIVTRQVLTRGDRRYYTRRIGEQDRPDYRTAVGYIRHSNQIRPRAHPAGRCRDLTVAPIITVTASPSCRGDRRRSRDQPFAVRIRATDRRR